MAFIPTIEIVNALVEKIAALTVPASDPAKPLFASVRAYDAPELFKALADLIETETSVCLVVPADKRHDGAGAKAFTGNIRRTLGITIMFSDTDYAPGVDEVFGSDDYPGLIQIDDWLTDALLGETLEIAGVSLVPVSGGPQILTDENDPSNQRHAWLARWETYAGEQEVDRSMT